MRTRLLHADSLAVAGPQDGVIMPKDPVKLFQEIVVAVMGNAPSDPPPPGEDAPRPPSKHSPNSDEIVLEPYGSRPGEGRSITRPADAELLTVTNILHRSFVEWPRQLIELIRCYVPIAPEPPRKCSLQLFNEIEAQLGPCVGFGAWFYMESGVRESHVSWLLDDEGRLFDAIDEYARALAELRDAIDALQIPLRSDLSSKSNVEIDDYYRPPIPPLKASYLTDMERTVNGIDILLKQCRKGLECAMEEAAGTESVSQGSQHEEGYYQGIMSLKGLWERVFPSYNRLVEALDKSGIVSQQKGGRRRKVEVGEFARWLNAIERTATRGFSPSDRSTWSDEIWDIVAGEYAEMMNTKEGMRRCQEG